MKDSEIKKITIQFLRDITDCDLCIRDEESCAPGTLCDRCLDFYFSNDPVQNFAFESSPETNNKLCLAITHLKKLVQADEDGEYVTTPMMRESKIIQDHDDDDSNYNDSSSSESRSSCSGHFDEGTWIWDNESYWE